MGSFQVVALIGVVIGATIVVGLVAVLFQDVLTGWIQRRIAIRKTYGTYRKPAKPNRDGV